MKNRDGKVKTLSTALDTLEPGVAENNQFCAFQLHKIGYFSQLARANQGIRVRLEAVRLDEATGGRSRRTG